MVRTIFYQHVQRISRLPERVQFCAAEIVVDAPAIARSLPDLTSHEAFYFHDDEAELLVEDKKVWDSNMRVANRILRMNGSGRTVAEGATKRIADDQLCFVAVTADFVWNMEHAHA